jgi:hypothetical protein
VLDRPQIRRLPRSIGVLLLGGLAVLVAVYRTELGEWIAGDRGATASGDEPAAFYTCSMDPSVESDHPGSCPICGMALTPVTKEDRSSGTVQITANTRARIGLAVAPVENKVLVRRVVASGEVIAQSPAGADQAAATASIAARVYRGDAREVRRGQAVTVSVPDLPLTPLPGTVASDAPDGLRLVVEDPGRALHPGMHAEVQIDLPLPPRLVVPAQAVLYAGAHRIVFVEQGSGRFKPRTPKLGAQSAGFVEVIDGLIAGESVVVRGAFLLAAESRLRSDGALWGDRPEPRALVPAPIKQPPPSSASPASNGW